MGLAAEEAALRPDADSSGLSKALYWLCNPDPNDSPIFGARQLDEVSLWSELQVAIGQTVLPRELTIYADGTAAARLLVARRRLHAVKLEAPLKTDSAPSHATALDFAELIKKACSTAQVLNVQITRREQFSYWTGPGCSGHQLLQAKQAQHSTDNAPDPFRLIRTIAEAYQICDINGQEKEAFGARELLDALRRLGAIQSENRGNDRRVSGTERDRLPICLVLPFRDQIKIVSTAVDIKRVAFAVHEEQLSYALDLCLRRKRTVR